MSQSPPSPSVPPTAPRNWRARLNTIVDSNAFQQAVIAAILLNAVLLGLETLPFAEGREGLIGAVDRAFVLFFLTELVLRVLAAGPRYFRSWWNLIDAAVIVGTVLASSSLFAALRAFRILRVLRVVTAFPRMRTVVQSLIESIPGIFSVALVGLLVTYVFAVIAATLFGDTHPEMFGDIFISMYTLFQVMTLEGWRDIADSVGQEHAHAWLFFVVFVLIGTFTMLNLFIAIVVRTVEEEAGETDDLVRTETAHLLEEMRHLSAQVAAIEAKLSDPTLADRPPRPATPPGDDQG